MDLPMIKCSNCGVDIDILQLADHVCATGAATAQGAYDTNPPKLERAATFGSPSFNNRWGDEPTRSQRMPPPPRIDSNVANQPFLAPDVVLAPSPLGNHGNLKGRSPISARNDKPPYQMNRSATSPMPRAPGPILTPNMDCAFPPFPTRRNDTPTSASSKSRARLEPSYDQRYAQPSPLFAPVSPRTNGGESVMKRMNTIAPGPFDGRADGRRPSTSGSGDPRTPGQETPPRGHRRTNTQSSVKSNGITPTQRTSVTSTASRGSPFSSAATGLSLRPKDEIEESEPMPPPPPPPPQQTEGIDAFLRRLQEETMKPSRISQENNRSKTHPMRKDSGDRSIAPSEPKGISRRPTDVDPSSSAPRSNNVFPPRGSSADESKSTMLRKDLPTLPPVPSYAREADQLNTPSDSGRSEDSYASSGLRSATSSRSSPPTSEAAHSRQASKAGRFDYLSEEPERRTYSPEPFTEPRQAPSIPDHGKRNGSSSRGRVPEPRSESRSANSPAGDRNRNDSSSRGRTPESRTRMPSRPPFPSSGQEPPLDPAIQLGIPFESPRDPALKFSHSPPPLSPPEQRQAPPARRPTTAARGNCRGCTQPIVGKSVKDSSGRLTGRYHKECFVCQTCSSPFPTAEFYVYNNFPYCEHHYHKLNDSICRGCNRGIEGQYLETDQRLKFHPRCFTCSTCRIVLRDDYYQVAGRNFCERHAFASPTEKQTDFLGTGGPGGRGGRNVQKRRTRLMMMA